MWSESVSTSELQVLHKKYLWKSLWFLVFWRQSSHDVAQVGLELSSALAIQGLESRYVPPHTQLKIFLQTFRGSD